MKLQKCNSISIKIIHHFITNKEFNLKNILQNKYVVVVKNWNEINSSQIDLYKVTTK